MIQAINDKVISILMTRKQTRNGIIIPNTVQEPQAFSQVISIGDAVSSVKKGDIIITHVRGGMDVVIDEKVIKVLKEDEIYGILTDKETIASLQKMKLMKINKEM